MYNRLSEKKKHYKPSSLILIFLNGKLSYVSNPFMRKLQRHRKRRNPGFHFRGRGIYDRWVKKVRDWSGTGLMYHNRIRFTADV